MAELVKLLKAKLYLTAWLSFSTDCYSFYLFFGDTFHSH